MKSKRSIGFFAATSIGVGAIVGGGILALAGVAFSNTGSGAIVAFAINGVIALFTALSFAELSTTFPESGGTYIFSKKVLSVQTAFGVGWIVWFASILAAVLYALGFASFVLPVIEQIFTLVKISPPIWIKNSWFLTTLAIAATLIYSLILSKKNAGGGQFINVSKLVVFSILIAGGLYVLTKQNSNVISTHILPMFPGGLQGLLKAMGFTFIALQGFDLISNVAGEIKNPKKTIPRAILLSLGIALIIYIPLLFVVSTAGIPAGTSLKIMSIKHPETIIALAANNYLGSFGYWLVIVAGILSMLSALQANLFSASRVALKMAVDRTLPTPLIVINKKTQTPVIAILITTFIIVIVLLVVPDLAAAGAAASLIFLLNFALAHVITILVRKRIGNNNVKISNSFRVPLFPLIPVSGVLTCLGLAIFQGVIVPEAGVISALWLIVGTFLFISLFSHRAKIVDAAAEAFNPELVKLRGRSPLVLVPIANPASAASLVSVADVMAPHHVGRVLLISVVKPPDRWKTGEFPPQLKDSQAILGASLSEAFSVGLTPEALTTISDNPWSEITRIVKAYRCESMLLGFSKPEDLNKGSNLEGLMNSVDCDVAILRAPSNWSLKQIKKILVPVGGKGTQDELRARILSSLSRFDSDVKRKITFLLVLPQKTNIVEKSIASKNVKRIVHDEIPGGADISIVNSNSVVNEISQWADKSDLMILGLQKIRKQGKTFGDLTLKLCQQTKCAILMLSKG